MATYKLIISKGHYLVDVDGLFYLLDTGAPNSLGEGSLIIASHAYPLCSNPELFAKFSNNSFIGSHIDGILGMDILKHYTVTIFKKEQKISFDECNIKYSSIVPLTIVMGAACLIDVAINGKETAAIIDSGACFSYVSSELLTSSPEVENINDFSPILGDIHTTLHQVEIKIGASLHTISVAKMIPAIELPLKMIGASSIIGLNEICSDVISFDFVNNVMKF